jgi:hypothetical protein
MAELAQRLNPWVFAIGFLLALAGSSVAITYVLQGNPASGEWTFSLGPFLVFVGAILMAVCYATRRY